MTNTRTMATAIGEIDQHLADLDGDLARMPEFKRGTPWHTDRVRARQGLVERRARLEAMLTPQPETCGYCEGSGLVNGPAYDREGRFRTDWPRRIACEYCGGSGMCEEGSKIVPCGRPPFAEA